MSPTYAKFLARMSGVTPVPSRVPCAFRRFSAPEEQASFPYRECTFPKKEKKTQSYRMTSLGRLTDRLAEDIMRRAGHGDGRAGHHRWVRGRAGAGVIEGM